MIAVPKIKRVEDRALLDSFWGLPCAICSTKEGTVAHHIKSKKSGGPDEDWNLLPLCMIHHTEIHKRGPSFMLQKYFHLNCILRKKGWSLDNYGRLRRRHETKENHRNR